MRHRVDNPWLAALVEGMPGVYGSIKDQADDGVKSANDMLAALKLRGGYTQDANIDEFSQLSLVDLDEEVDAFLKSISIPALIEKRERKLKMLQQGGDDVTGDASKALEKSDLETKAGGMSPDMPARVEKALVESDHEMEDENVFQDK